MEFIPAVKTCMTKYIDINGRASRSEYWWFVLSYVILVIIASFISQNLATLVLLVYLCPLITAQVRRLHDGDRSGWWVLLGLIPIANLVLLYFLIIKGTEGSNRFGGPAA